MVLPFICLGSDPDDEYFADGLTDELITALTRVPGLKVVARTSSFTFKGRADDIRGIGATLHVDTAIEGSLRRQGDLLRIHVQLVSIRDGCNIWAAKYERRMAGVFQLQEEIAAAIVGASEDGVATPYPTGGARRRPGSACALSEGPVLVASLESGGAT